MCISLVDDMQVLVVDRSQLMTCRSSTAGPGWTQLSPRRIFVAAYPWSGDVPGSIPPPTEYAPNNDDRLQENVAKSPERQCQCCACTLEPTCSPLHMIRNRWEFTKSRDSLMKAAAKSTVKGELGVASFLVNFFKRGPFLDVSGCAPLPSCTTRQSQPLSCQPRPWHRNWMLHSIF